MLKFRYTWTSISMKPFPHFCQACLHCLLRTRQFRSIISARLNSTWREAWPSHDNAERELAEPVNVCGVWCRVTRLSRCIKLQRLAECRRDEDDDDMGRVLDGEPLRMCSRFYLVTRTSPSGARHCVSCAHRKDPNANYTPISRVCIPIRRHT